MVSMIKSIIMRDLKEVLVLVFSGKDFTTFSKKDYFWGGGGEGGYLKRNIDVSGLLLVFANFFTVRIIVNFLEFSSDFLFFRTFSRRLRIF